MMPGFSIIILSGQPDVKLKVNLVVVWVFVHAGAAIGLLAGGVPDYHTRRIGNLKRLQSMGIVNVVEPTGLGHRHKPAPQPDVFLDKGASVVSLSNKLAFEVIVINRHRSAGGLDGAPPHAVDYIIGLLGAAHHRPDQALALAIGQGNVSMSCYITVCIMGECLWILAGYGRNLIGACVVGVGVG